MDGTGVNLTLVARNLWGKMSRGWRNQDEDMLAGSRGGTVMTAERGGMDGIRVGKGSGDGEVWIRT